MVHLTPNPSYSLSLKIEIPNQAGTFASVLNAIADVGGNLGQISLIERNLKISTREVMVDAASTDQAEQIIAAVKALPDVKLLKVSDRTFDLHRRGKISIESRIPLTSQDDLAMAYTPGVGRICTAIAHQPEQVYSLTIKGNTVAVVTDGSAVLGLGNLGPEAA
ncbi:MAG: ACT domain-containing protein, partial [Microcystis sp.]